MNGVGTYQLPNSNTSIDPIYTYDDYGSYLVSLTVTDNNGCSDTWDSTIVVRPIPTTIFTIVDTVCVGFNTEFLDQSIITNPLGGTITNWDWNMNGAGTYSTVPPTNNTSQNPIYAFNNFNTFNVQLIITDQYGCMDSVSHPIDVNPGPIACLLYTSDAADE